MKSSISQLIIFCNNNGVFIYPIYHQGCWKIQAEDNGKEIIYNKAIGYNQTLTNKEYQGSLSKSLTFWREKIQKRQKQ